MHLSPNGKLTIPVEIREQLGIADDTALEFEIANNRLYIQKKHPTDPISTWITTMGGTLPDVTTDEIMTLTRQSETQ